VVNGAFELDADRIYALALCQRPDRYLRGNRKALGVVRVPSEEEESERAFSRQRQQERQPAGACDACEMVWRMIRWQPEYRALRKWMPVPGDAKGSAAARNKAIIYALPMQLPMMNLMLCLFVLLVMMLTGEEG
jgi:hypothetical protein